MATGYWELGRNLQDCNFSCHLCGQGGFRNVQSLTDHTNILCPNRDNDIDWGDPDEWLEQSTVRSDFSEASFNNESQIDTDCIDRVTIDPELDTTTSIEELKCPICFDKKIAVVSLCGHCLCHGCCKALDSKQTTSCPTCRKPWSIKNARSIFI